MYLTTLRIESNCVARLLLDCLKWCCYNMMRNISIVPVCRIMKQLKLKKTSGTTISKHCNTNTSSCCLLLIYTQIVEQLIILTFSSLKHSFVTLVVKRVNYHTIISYVGLKIRCSCVGGTYFPVINPCAGE